MTIVCTFIILVFHSICLIVTLNNSIFFILAIYSFSNTSFLNTSHIFEVLATTLLKPDEGSTSKLSPHLPAPWGLWLLGRERGGGQKGWGWAVLRAGLQGGPVHCGVGNKCSLNWMWASMLDLRACLWVLPWATHRGSNAIGWLSTRMRFFSPPR